MERSEHGNDTQAIEALTLRQFTSLNWQSGATADREAFSSDFRSNASLYPSGRPAKQQSVEVFVERMKGLVGTKLHTFHESVLGTEIFVFGNVAVAVAACEMVENGTHVNRGVEMLLLLKNECVWQTAAQAWDSETPSNPIPNRLLSRNASA